MQQSNNISVRPIGRNDFEAWKPLWDGYNAFYGRSGETALDPRITETTWERFFDDDEPVYALVAESSGEILGIVHYLFHRSTISIKPVCYLQDLFTAETARGKGIASALIRAVYEGAQARGASRVYWQTHNTNATARRVYDKLAEDSGFIVYRKLL